MQPFFFLVLEWLKVREGGDVTPLKEILCNREQIAILLGGGGQWRLKVEC